MESPMPIYFSLYPQVKFRTSDIFQYSGGRWFSDIEETTLEMAYFLTGIISEKQNDGEMIFALTGILNSGDNALISVLETLNIYMKYNESTERIISSIYPIYYDAH